jgi:hypothetical protein
MYGQKDEGSSCLIATHTYDSRALSSTVTLLVFSVQGGLLKLAQTEDRRFVSCV